MAEDLAAANVAYDRAVQEWFDGTGLENKPDYISFLAGWLGRMNYEDREDPPVCWCRADEEPLGVRLSIWCPVHDGDGKALPLL